MENTESNKNRGYGISAMTSSYTFNDFAKDSFFPLVTSLVLLGLCHHYVEDTYTLVCKVIEISLTIIPAMIALMLTAYVFVMSFLFNKDIASTMTNPEEGEKLLYIVNASFGISLLVNVCAIITFFVIYCVAQINIPFVNADIINYIVFFCVSSLVLFSIVMQVGIIIDLFNCGQVFIRKSHDNTPKEQPR